LVAFENSLTPNYHINANAKMPFKVVNLKPFFLFFNSTFYVKQRKPVLGQFYGNSIKNLKSNPLKTCLIFCKNIQHSWNGLNQTDDFVQEIIIHLINLLINFSCI